MPIRRVTVMKSTGMNRKIDELGRIVIPMEIRRTLDIKEKDQLEIFVEGNTVILKKFEPACVFCGDIRNVLTHRERLVCHNCISELADINR